MKTLIKQFFTLAALLIFQNIEAQIIISDNGIMVSDIKTQQTGNRMDVMMRVDMSQLKIKSNRTIPNKRTGVDTDASHHHRWPQTLYRTPQRER